MPGLTDFRFERQGDVVAVELRGEIDLSSVRDIDANLRGSVPNTALGIVIDLSRVEYFDSSALQMLFELAEIETAAHVFATMSAAVAELRAGLAVPSEGSDAPPGSSAVERD